MKSNKKKSILQEKRLSKKLNARRVPASGAIKIGGGYDLNHDDFAIEAKRSEREFYMLRHKDLIKISKIAYQKLKRPLFVIEFIHSKRIFVLTASTWLPDLPKINIITESFQISDNSIFMELKDKTAIYLIWENKEVNIWKLQYLETWQKEEEEWKKQQQI